MQSHSKQDEITRTRKRATLYMYAALAVLIALILGAIFSGSFVLLGLTPLAVIDGVLFTGAVMLRNHPSTFNAPELMDTIVNLKPDAIMNTVGGRSYMIELLRNSPTPETCAAVAKILEDEIE